MWRKTSFADDEDSDQSISEEEDFAPDSPENCIPLSVTARRKGGIQIQSQLELLRDTHELDHGRKAAKELVKVQIGLPSEDELEVSVFRKECDFFSSPARLPTCNLDEEIISADEEIYLGTPRSRKQHGACSWSAETKEAEALGHLIENARRSSLHSTTFNVNKPYKGGHGKDKSKLSFRFQSHKEVISCPVSSEAEVDLSSKAFPLPQETEAVDNRKKDILVTEVTENSQGGKVEHPEIYGVPGEVTIGHGYTERSMVEILDNYQEKTGRPRGNSKLYARTRTKGKRVQLIDESSVSLLGKRNIDSGDSPEAFNSESSSEDEAVVQDLGLIIPEASEKTMADKFQEAFGAGTGAGAAINDERSHFVLHGGGIFEKLQRVMQSEKRRDMDFFKMKQTGASSGYEAGCIRVEILSRCLEAKLTVCCCSLSRDNESSQGEESFQMLKVQQRRTLTIIFSTRVCDDVELEVGNLICIHSPWKEVQAAGKDEVIILSAYFSQILA